MGTVDPDTADLLRALVRARMSIVVSGGTSSGKTTLLNALSGFIPAEERIVTIEDSAELQLQQPHVISLEARPPNVEGKGQVTIRDLVRNALRMRPDRIVVGEVRGPETIDMLQAMNTGHDGSLTTVHANSTEDSVVRMQTLASMSEVDVPFVALRDQINSAIDVIVQLERSADGRRRIIEVAAVSSRLREEFRLATIMRFDPDPIGPDRVVTGTWVHYPLPDIVAERLRVRAEIAPAVYTEEAADELEAPERKLEQPEADRLSRTAGPDAPLG
jgi:pilus assembly protein CpaF